jgi:hypothetical protein
MRVRLMSLFLFLTLLATPTLTQAAQTVTPTVVRVPVCPSTPPWVEERPALGGFYVGNGWENGIFYLLQLVAVGGNIQGVFFDAEFTDDGSSEVNSYSVSGIYDDSQISLQIDRTFDSFTMYGSWSSAGLALSYPGSDKTIANGFFTSANEDDAVWLLESWVDRARRDGAANDALRSMYGVYQNLGIASDLSSEPERLSAYQVTISLGMPGSDSLSLLSLGWMASARFTARQIGSLPNQINDYQLHVLEVGADSRVIALCAMENRYGYAGFKPLEENRELDFLFATETDIHTVENSQVPGSVTIVAGLDRAVVTITAFGDAESRSNAIESASLLLEAYAHPGDGMGS